MCLKSLNVVHIYQYRKEHGVESPVNILRKKITPFSPSTCARQLHIFNHLVTSNVKNICEEIKKTSDICEYLQGDDAYFFLLKWAVGIESNKYNHNDNHVLGKLRSEWTKFLTNKPKRAKNLEPTLNMLFQDARCIRKHIQTQYGSTINNKQMPQFLLNIAKVCHDFTQLRAKGLTPQLSEKNEIIDSSSMLKISIEKISKDLKKIQLQTASDSNFLPSEISPKTKNRKKQSYMFNHAISIAKLNREYNIEYIDKMSSHEKSSGLSLIC